MDHVPSAWKHDAYGPAAGGGGWPLIRALFLGLCLALAVGFAALGVWQVERLQWKQALIATVEARLAAAPVVPPSAPDWSPDQAYTRVVVEGVFRNDRETLVQALTERGAGFWVLTPLDTGQGVILINRGFVTPELRDPAARPAVAPTGPVSVTGLLRASEPGGAALRANAPADGRWYSRDVAAIAAARGLTGRVAPYFIDADASATPNAWPVGGLTVVRFPNSHLVYALTWFGLCALSIAGAVLVWRDRRRRPDISAARS